MPAPNSDTVVPPPASPNIKASLLKRAQSSLRQTIKRYTEQAVSAPQASSQTDLQMQLERLTKDLNKLEHHVLRIAVFGMVSRGKSSVINALVQREVLQTGPLHGVTKWPRSVYWEPEENASQLRVELIDTPGLDEVDGVARAEMAQEVAQEADLILFVLAGDLTQVEYSALVQLRQQRKPLVLVCNKMDQYPNHDKATLLRQLEALEQSASKHSPNEDTKIGKAMESVMPSATSDRPLSDPGASTLWTLTANDVVSIAAAPAPIQVRVEWPDGRITHEWETPKPQIEALEQHLHQILAREGPLLIALNALRDSQSAEVAIAATAMESKTEQAEALLWQFAKWKGLAIAANPIAILDVAGGVAIDLVLIRSLARLYGLPMTGYDAGKLWNAIVWSAGGLAVGEIGSGLFSGIGKSTTLLTGGLGGIVMYPTTAIAQAVLAGYGSYRVGKAAQIYLQQGCTWGPYGSSTVMETLFSQMDDTALLSRLKEQLVPQQQKTKTEGNPKNR
ncbi:MAG: DUF697 domain-containing protein [Merismopedia sp. SIO2A8]|nr:DUF697 domain-containing protein [Merismopedia sp. SIO2A8]